MAILHPSYDVECIISLEVFCDLSHSTRVAYASDADLGSTDSQESMAYPCLTPQLSQDRSRASCVKGQHIASECWSGYSCEMGLVFLKQVWYSSSSFRLSV